LEQDRNMPKNQTCPYMQQSMIMNWQCYCCPCMTQQPMPYKSGHHKRTEGENEYENKDNDEDKDIRVWERPIKGYHKWNGDPMYGPGWYHYHWDGHNWNGPWHDKKPYNNGWHDNSKREDEET